MINSLEATSSFDKASYEVLDLIIQYLQDRPRDLCQLRMVNKRCQSIAEKYLFKKFTLFSDTSISRMMEYTHFLTHPEHCKLVKILNIEEDPFLALSDDFFQRFRDIEEVEYDEDAYIDWKQFSKTFTPNRCKLKRLPYCNNIEKSDVNSYLKILRGHTHTLESLDFNPMDENIASQLVKSIGRSLNFPQLKSFSFDWPDSTFQPIDTAINKCPLLNELDVDFVAKNHRLTPWTPNVKHQQLMRTISFRVPRPELFDCAYTYFVAKFPNVEKWKVSNHTFTRMHYEEEGAVICPFEEFVDKLHLLMNSMRVDFDIATTYSSFPRILDFMKLYKVNTNISIDYQLPEDQLILDPTEHEKFTKDLFFMKLHYSRSRSSILDNSTEITYVSEALEHLDFLREHGHCIQKLDLSLDRFSLTETKNVEILDMIQGGALTHLMEHCTMLTSVEYCAKSLSSFAHPRRVSKDLKKVVLRCEKISPEAFVNLSHAVPTIDHLIIDSPFTKDSFGKKKTIQILIDMPESKFKRLELREYFFEVVHKNILIQINSSVPNETKYYIRKLAEDLRVPLNTSNEQEHSVYSERPHLKIIVNCKSTEYLGYFIGEIDDVPLAILEIFN